MKYAIFFLTLIFGVPIGTSMAKKNPRVEKLVFFFLIFFTVKEVTINFVSREWYRGTSRGFEIGMVDIALLILLQLVNSRKRWYPTTKYPPGTILYALYFFFSLLSITNSATGYVVNSWFEIWKMVRMYAYFWVVNNYINDWKKIEELMQFVSIVVLYIGFTVLKQKYVEHRFQTPGPFPHQNSLVMYLIVFNSLVFSYLLNRKKIKLWYWLAVFGLGSLSIVSTLSRAGMACYVIACVTVWFFSFISGFSAKKIGVTLLLLLMATFGLIKAMDSIVERFETAPEESGITRIVLAQAAAMMANDKLLGIGLNNFGLKINPPYPYSDHIYPALHDGKMPPEDYEEKNGLVETIYLMIAAETGWHNLGIFLTFLFVFYFRNFRNYRLMKLSEYRFVAIGLLGGLLGIYVESSLEWVLKQTNNFYQLMLVFALINVCYKLYNRQLQEQRQAALQGAMA